MFSTPPHIPESVRQNPRILFKVIKKIDELTCRITGYSPLTWIDRPSNSEIKDSNNAVFNSVMQKQSEPSLSAMMWWLFSSRTIGPRLLIASHGVNKPMSTFHGRREKRQPVQYCHPLRKQCLTRSGHRPLQVYGRCSNTEDWLESRFLRRWWKFRSKHRNHLAGKTYPQNIRWLYLKSWLPHFEREIHRSHPEHHW